MEKLFNAVKEGHDSNNRIVFLCKDANGVYVFKPSNGFKSKHYPGEEEEAAIDCITRQVGCGDPHGCYDDHERPSDNEEYPEPGQSSEKKN